MLELSPRRLLLGLVALLALAGTPRPGAAADAEAGRAIYTALPGDPGPGSCVSCHGDPADNRNNLLIAAGRPERIQRAMNTVSAMGFLRSYLNDGQVADVAAYLATIVPIDGLGRLPTTLPTVDHFGGQLVGTTSEVRPVLFVNRTSAPIAVATVVVTRPDVFRLVADCPSSLPIGAACTAQLRFAPAAAGDVSALVSMLDPAGATLRSATVHGIGRATPPGTLGWREGRPALTFGDVVVGEAATRSATLVNLGSEPVRLERLRMSGPAAARFLLEGSSCATGSVLGPGADCGLSLRYAPTVEGESQAWVEIVSDAANAPLVVASARAVAAPTPTPPAEEQADASSSGGCTIGDATSVLDPTLWLLVLAALAVLRGRRRRVPGLS